MHDYRRMLVWMSLFLALVGGACAVLWPQLRTVFEANVVFNGLILAAFALGALIDFGQVIALGPSARWVGQVGHGATSRTAPQLVWPLARVLEGREGPALHLSPPTMRALLDGVRLRLDETRDVSRYIVGLLIFLGLLGTFWGLLDAIGGVGRVMRDLTGAAAGDPAAVLGSLQRDLQQPLSGMATAFSSSLFGLAGALALGVLDLQVGHAQNRFVDRLEEWLAGLVRLPGGTAGVGEGGATLPAYVEALLEHTAESLSQVQGTLARGADERRAQHATLGTLAERLAELTDQLRGEQRLLVTLARTQTDLQPAMAELADHVRRGAAMQDELRTSLRNVELALGRLLAEVRAARERLPDERREAALAEPGRGRRGHGGF